MKVVKLSVERFRHLSNIEMTFGNRITAIAGQNGTGKSSILGLVGHIFSYREKDNTIKYKTLDSKPFETQFSEIFRFSYPNYDKPGDHLYSIELDANDKIEVVSSDRIERGKDKTLRLNVGKKAKGEGKRELPVIYLGLRRLFPLAQEEKIGNPISNLSQDEINKYQQLHNEILMLNEKIEPEYVDTFSKKFYATKTDKYDCLGDSAGQDNIGQIITAVLSFERLKQEQKEKYSGGLLLVDELDATLYPGAQEKLLEKLFRISQDLDLQIIFTTHSPEILNRLMTEQYKHDSEVIFLDNTSGKVCNVQGKVNLNQIINNLKVLYPLVENENKVMVFCEDNEARLWMKNLLGTKLCKRISIIPDSFGAGNLVFIANKKIPVFKKSIFVLDGDQKKSLKTNKCPRVILLPGTERPEDIFYKYLRALPANDEFWGGTGGYTQQLCFRDRASIHTDRAEMKKWFQSQLPYWGNGASKLFNRWKKDNLEVSNGFKNEFENQINSIA